MLLDVVCDLLALFEQVLQNELSTGVFEDGVGDLSDGQTEVLNAVVCEPGVDDFIVDGRVDVDGDVVLGDDVLARKDRTCRARSRTWILVLIMPRVSVQGLI